MTDKQIEIELCLAAQIALLGAVPPRLRCVTCDWRDTEVSLRFVLDGAISEHDKETAQIVGTEVIAAFPSPWTIDEDIVRLDYPADKRDGALRLWVYAREEPESNDSI